MRILMWFTIGFAGAIAAAVYLQLSEWLLLGAGIVAVCAAVLFFLPGKAARRSAVAVLGICTALCWMWCVDRFYLSAARACDGMVVDTVITVDDYSYETDFGVGADGRLLLDGKRYRVRFYLDTTEELTPGDVVKGTFKLRYAAFGGSEDPTYHPAEGIFLLAYPQENAALSQEKVDAFRLFPAKLRRWILDKVSTLFPSDTLAFARALLLGDSSLLSYAEDSAFKISGIRHIIATSGLHICILFTAIYGLLGKRLGLTSLIGIPVLILFAALAGFTPSVIRACVMQIMMLVALLINREYDSPTALSLAVLLILAVNPMSVTSIGFQLSVGCIAGMLMFSERISGYLLHKDRFGPAKGNGIKSRLTRWFVGSVSVSLSTMVFTTPLCAVYFGTVSIVGVLTNLLTVWIVSFIFCGVALAVILGAVWLPMGIAAAWVVSWPIRFVQLIAKLLSGIPMAAVYTSSVYIVIWLVLCYLLFVFMMCSKHKRPMIVCGCMATALIAALLASWLEPETDKGRIYALDVGQGQCIVLQTESAVYMVDCGGDGDAYAADVAVQTLLSYGITKLDGLIVTHYDVDHAGGVSNLLSRIPVDCVYLPQEEEPSDLRLRIESAAEEKVRYVEDVTIVNKNEAKLTLCPAPQAQTKNETSLCILFQAENCDILITGDRNTYGEHILLDQISIPKIEILVAGHHGAVDSVGLELLNITRPNTVIISAGEDNPYGHPHAQTLQRIAQYGCRILRTDLEGTIIVRW